MPGGRAVTLLRRLSASDGRIKNIGNLNQNCKDQLLPTPVCCHRDLGKRFSTFAKSDTPKLPHPRTRSLSDSITRMAASSGENSPDGPKHTNKLINEKSPYLLQHAHNPVDWYPWGDEALQKAKAENKLIFLSVGYSTCHWCHVMEKESFENEDIAKVMNEHFINIKVDREERPDIDRVYMLFVVATTGAGGWPMSVFLTPDLKPVTGGTYYPPEDRCWGRPGFKSILMSLGMKWKEDTKQFYDASASILEAMKKVTLVNPTESSMTIPGEKTWEKCVDRYIKSYESEFGGFGSAPKFPQASIFNFLFHYYARDKTYSNGKKCLEMCLHTLTKIAKGGIRDHISGGFARYSVDNDWHVPHFEKMLYDQAQLTIAFTDAYLATKNEFYAGVIRDVIKYVNRDLRHDSGGYYSAEDADSYPTYGDTHKTEGAFYVWEYKQLKSLFNDKKINSIPYLDIFCDYFSVEEDGNVGPDSDPHDELTNKNILIIYGSKEKSAKKFGLTLEEFDRVIYECVDLAHEARLQRPRPHLDSKIICSWNGLMIAGLAQAGQGLGDKDYVEDAIKAATFLKEHLYDELTKTLLHSCYRDDDGSIVQSKTPIKGFLDDYAFLIKGLLDLYEASLDCSWLKWAQELQHKQNDLFWDTQHGGYFTCSDEDNSVVLRLKEDQDGAEPSGNSVACHNLQRLAAYADKSASPEGGEHERQLAKRLLQAFANRLDESPTALPEMMSALMFYNDSPTQVLIAGGRSDPRTLELVRVVRSRLLPGRVLAVADPAAAETVAGMSDILLARIRGSDVPRAYVCRRYACSLPVTDVKQLEELLDGVPCAPHATGD